MKHSWKIFILYNRVFRKDLIVWVERRHQMQVWVTWSRRSAYRGCMSSPQSAQVQLPALSSPFPVSICTFTKGHRCSKKILKTYVWTRNSIRIRLESRIPLGNTVPVREDNNCHSKKPATETRSRRKHIFQKVSLKSAHLFNDCSEVAIVTRN